MPRNDLDELKKIVAVEEERIAAIKQKREDLETTDDLFTPDELEAADKEVEREKKFGDRTGTAGALGAARGLTFGLSDQALTKTGIMTPEELREIEERNKAASIAGEITGAVAPAVSTGGAGLLGTIAKGAGVGVRGTLAAGRATEKIAEKALAKAIKQSGEQRLAKEIIKKAVPKTAGSAVEGAAFGAGELISEDALGRADFNAENLLGSVGTGALFAGAAGAGISAVPMLFNPVGKVAKRGVTAAGKRAAALADPEDNAMDLLGMTTVQKMKLKKNRPDIVTDLPDFLVTQAKLGKFTTDDDLLTAVQKIKKSSGEQIGSTLKTLDDLAVVEPGILPTREQLFAPIIKKLDDDIIAPRAGKKAFKSQLKPVQRIREDLLDEMSKGGVINAQSLQTLRQQMDELAQFRKAAGEVTLGQRAARDIRTALRGEIDSLANRADRVANEEAGDLLRNLKQANKNYSIAAAVEPSVARKVAKPERIASLTDLVAGGIGAELGIEGLFAGIGIKKLLESDFRRRLAVLSAVEKKNQQVQSKVKSSIRDFFTKGRTPARVARQKILVESGFSAKREDGKIKQPKSRKEAFQNIKSNLEELQADPNKLVERIAKGTAGLNVVAPRTASAAQETMARAVAFVTSKLPQDLVSQRGLAALSRPYEPSELEMSKFERYVSAVEDPMSLLDDLKSGTATTEQVEAVREVYPNLYHRIVGETMVYLNDPDNKVSYQKRTQLGIVLDIPTDPSLTPENIKELQTPFVEQREDVSEGEVATAPGAVTPTSKSMRELNFAARTATTGQHFAKRRATGE